MTTSTIKRPTNGLLNEITALDPPVRYRRKLNRKAVLKARLMFAAGFTKAEIARSPGMDCTPQNIHLVVTRRTWRNI